MTIMAQTESQNISTTTQDGRRSANGKTRCALVAATLTGLAVLLTGCAGGGAGAQTSDGRPTVTAEQCAQVAAAEPAPSAQTVALVIDRTASGKVGELPPAVTHALARAQKAGEKLAVVSVNGPGANPVTSRTIALDPAPNVDSQVADNIRAAALACLAATLNSDALAPTSPGSDQLAAIATAGRQAPSQILVVSDGVSTGTLDIARVGFDADAASVAGALAKSDQLPNLRGVPVTWTGLGDTAAVMPQPARAGLQAIWTAVLEEAHGKVTFDTRTSPSEGDGDPAAITVSASVKDPTPSYVVKPVKVGSVFCLTLPTGILFAPDSAELGDRSPLTDIAGQLAGHPSWVADIVGHAADYGSKSGQVALSKDRAKAVAAALRTLGVPDSTVLETSGVGSAEPAVNEWPNGVHDDAAASKNRRVVVSYGDPAALAANTCH